MCAVRRAQRPAWYRRCLLAALLLTALAPQSRAANIRWTAGNGTFHTGGSWQGGVAPGLLDVAQFGRSAAPFQLTYTVSFTVDATNQALHVEDDVVTFDLNGRLYSLTAATGTVIGNQPSGLAGSLTVTDGTINSTTNIDVGAAASTSGTLIVSTGGVIGGSPALSIGKLGAGALTVQQGGDITGASSTSIGVNTGINGTVTIFGAGSTLVTGALNVGNTGNGTIHVQVGGLLQNNADAVVGAGNLFTGVGTGIVNVTGVGSTWKSLGLLEIGDGGSGEVNVTNGGMLTSVDTLVGVITSSSGEVNVNGAAALWDNSGDITIGALGVGTLNITNQGVVNTDHGFIGDAALGPLRGQGTVTVSGAGSQWNAANRLYVGVSGTGTLNIAAGAAVHDDQGLVGLSEGGVGEVAVQGEGSLWNSSTLLLVGNYGMGTLTVTGGADVQSDSAIIGGRVPGTGHVTVDGPGSLLSVAEELTVALEGEGTLEITGGGKVSTFSGKIGVASEGTGDSGLNGTGRVLVDGAGSLWQSTGAIFIGRSRGGGDATLEITDGGKVQVTAHSIINKGLLKVDGAGSLWTNNDQLVIGNDAQGAVEITAGGTVSNRGAIVGFRSPSGVDSQGTVTVGSAVAGAVSTWQIEGQLGVGYDFVSLHNSGVGKVFIQPGGAVTVTQDTSVSFGDLLTLEGGTLTAQRIRFPDGGSDANFQWTSGTLHVIEFDGSLINLGGVLAPANTTDVDGNYTQLAGATLDIGIGGVVQAAQHDFVHVTANAILGGDLDLTLLGGFVPAVTDTFTVLQADLNIFNSFANVTSGQRLDTTDGHGSFIVNYGAGSPFDPKRIVLSNFLPDGEFAEADFDRDGDVDRDDLLQWQGDYALNDDSNADGDADSDGADFLIWQQQLGAGSSSTAGGAIPEPATASPLILAISVLAPAMRLRQKPLDPAPSLRRGGMGRGDAPHQM